MDVGDAVYDSFRSENVGVLGQQRRRDDPLLVLPALEVGIREAEEEFRELALGEKVGEELHGVASDDGRVLELSRLKQAEGGDAISDVGRDLVTDLHAEDDLLGKELGEGDGKTTEAASNVGVLDLLEGGRRRALAGKGGSVEERRKVGRPVHGGRTGGTVSAAEVGQFSESRGCRREEVMEDELTSRNHGPQAGSRGLVDDKTSSAQDKKKRSQLSFLVRRQREGQDEPEGA